jgi:hypothetical protein
MTKKNSIINLIFLWLFIPGIVLLLFKIYGPFTVNPALFFSGLLNDDSIRLFDPFVRDWYGWPTIEPNVGVSSFVGGHLASKDIFSGSMPLWNYYSGLGTPLLADFQSASFFPFAG